MTAHNSDGRFNVLSVKIAAAGTRKTTNNPFPKFQAGALAAKPKTPDDTAQMSSSIPITMMLIRSFVMFVGWPGLERLRKTPDLMSPGRPSGPAPATLR